MGRKGERTEKNRFGVGGLSLGAFCIVILVGLQIPLMKKEGVLKRNCFAR